MNRAFTCDSRGEKRHDECLFGTVRWRRRSAGQSPSTTGAKAFTLAEVMITLTVIGIISAIIMPIALRSVPDENVMKFKKANSTLYQVIQELVNSDKYYKDGDLGIKADGTIIDGNHKNDYTYFCNTFSDIVSTKTTDCREITVDKMCHMHKYWEDEGLMDDVSKYLDDECKTTPVGAQIVTNDGVTFFEQCPNASFGIYWVSDGDYQGRPTTDATYKRLFDVKPSQYKSEFVGVYKIFCFDVDGLNKGEDPFGYGIRADGKIYAGKRAKEWLEKDIQGE